MALYRNQTSHFAVNPTIDIKRSTFNRKFGIKTSFNAGLLIPLDWDEVLPGDTFSVDMSEIVRMSTPLFPIMDEIYLDTYFFFIPNRIIWEHWKEFNGENTTSKWEQETEYEIPQITAPTGGWEKGTIMDYLGVPTKVANLSVNHLPVRAYVLTWNEWFRDQNLQDPAYLSHEDATTTGTNGSNYVTDAITGGMPLPVNKYHDYFTSALPEPQKGPETILPIGTTAPVYSTTENEKANNTAPVKIWYRDGNSQPTSQTLLSQRNGDLSEATPNGGVTISYGRGLVFNNLQTDLSTATGVNINQLRQAFQIQKAFEKDARGGTRYTEIIYSHFGVTSPDSRQQRPEYLGGARVPININQVVQTSSTDSTSPQGNTAAYSLTGYKGNGFTKSFTEHGIILTLIAVRTTHTYQQGIEKKWSRQKRFDYYWPVFANIGEQAILNKEIYAQGNTTDNEAFGYQEAWAEYRYKPNRVSGAMRSNYTKTLDAWHLADEYASLPVLGDTWIRETTANIDRTLAVQSSNEDQFFGDFFFVNKSTRPMPLYSIPGLVDHH